MHFPVLFDLLLRQFERLLQVLLLFVPLLFLLLELRLVQLYYFLQLLVVLRLQSINVFLSLF